MMIGGVVAMIVVIIITPPPFRMDNGAAQRLSVVDEMGVTLLYSGLCLPWGKWCIYP